MADTIHQDKRNAKGGGSVRQREDGRWEARCTIAGKRRSFYADTQKEVLKQMRQAQKSGDEGTFVEPSRLTVGQWVDIWLEEYYKQTVKRSTYVNQKAYIERYIKPQLGYIKIQALTPTHIQAFYNQLNKSLSATTTRHCHATLHYSLEQAVELKYISVNPSSACKLPAKEKKEMHPLTEEELRNFLQAVEDEPLPSPYKDIFLVTLFTGMRRGEVLGLPWDAVDFKNGTVTVKQQLQTTLQRGEQPYISTPKSNKSRTLTPAPFVMDILQRVRQEQFKNHLAVGLGWKNDWNLVFTRADGKYINENMLHTYFKRVCTKIGCPDFRFHDLRHTYAVTALQEGDNPKTVQEALGHATAAFTLNVYAHVSEKMKKDSADRLQNYYEKMKA